MYTVIISEHEASAPVTRMKVDSTHAHKLGSQGGFYKVQLVNEFGIVEYEYKEVI